MNTANKSDVRSRREFVEGSLATMNLITLFWLTNRDADDEDWGLEREETGPGQLVAGRETLHAS